MSTAQAGVTEFDGGIDDWSNVAGEFTTIGLSEYPAGTLITEQDSDPGIHFTEGDDDIVENLNHSDNFSLGDSEFGPSEPSNIWVDTDQPMTEIGAHYPGTVKFEFFDDGESIYTNDILVQRGDPRIQFAGLVSVQPFDTVRIPVPEGVLFIDDLHAGPPNPAPGALGLLGIAAIGRPGAPSATSLKAQKNGGHDARRCATAVMFLLTRLRLRWARRPWPARAPRVCRCLRPPQ